MHIGSEDGSNDVFRIPTQAMRSSVHLSRLYTRGNHPSWPDAKCTLLNSFERRVLWCPRWSLAATDICPAASGKGRKCTERVKHGRLVILNRIYSGGCLVVQMGWMTILHAASRKRQYSGNLAETGLVKEFWWSEYCFKKSNWKWLKENFQGGGRGDKLSLTLEAPEDVFELGLESDLSMDWRFFLVEAEVGWPPECSPTNKVHTYF